MNPVLVVEDNPDLREAIGSTLEENGFEVELAENGKQALQLLKRRRPFLILLDLMMPVMNGWEFLEHFQRDRRISDIPLIVCSVARDPHVSNFENMKKPIDLNKLLFTVRRYFSNSDIVRHP